MHNDVSTWQYTIFKPTLYTSGMVHFWNVFVHKPWDSVFYEWVVRVGPGDFFLKPGTLAKCMSWITVRHVYPAKNSLPGSRTRLVVNTLHMLLMIIIPYDCLDISSILVWRVCIQGRGVGFDSYLFVSLAREIWVLLISTVQNDQKVFASPEEEVCCKLNHTRVRTFRKVSWREQILRDWERIIPCKTARRVLMLQMCCEEKQWTLQKIKKLWNRWRQTLMFPNEMKWF